MSIVHDSHVSLYDPTPVGLGSPAANAPAKASSCDANGGSVKNEEHHFGVNTELSDPRIVAVGSDGVCTLPMEEMKLCIELQLGVAIVNVKGVWRFDESSRSCIGSSSPGFMFELPTTHNMTVTSTNVSLENGVVFQAQVVEETAALSGYKNNEGGGMAYAINYYLDRRGVNPLAYNPQVFTFPFHRAQVSETITVEADFIINLPFEDGGYKMSLPLTLASTGLKLDVCMSIAVPNCLTTHDAPPRWSSTGLCLKQTSYVSVEDGICKLGLSLDKTVASDGSNFLFWLEASLEQIQCQALCDHSPTYRLVGDKFETTQGGVVSSFITAPRSVSEQGDYHSRDVVFMLDRSGSMGFSGVFELSKGALISALRQLNPNDRFAICCFDDRQVWFGGCSPEPSEEMIETLLTALGVQSTLPKTTTTTSSLNTACKTPLDEAPNGSAPSQQTVERSRPLCVSAKPEYIEKAIQWLEALGPSGLTDIITPVKQAFWGLFNDDMQSQRLKMMFLITDGAVNEERDICRFVASISHICRVFAFGIGFDCNAYFLRKLASVGRGYADVCFIESSIAEQMRLMFTHARHAILKDVRVEFEGGANGLEQVRWCPKVLPDLYCHSPVIVSCQYAGVLEPGLKLRISGERPDGTRYETTIPIQTTRVIPLRKIFSQQQVEMLVADTWFADVESAEGKQLRKECVNIAVAESIPCPFATMVALELTQESRNGPQLEWTNETERRLRFRVNPANAVKLGASVGAGVAFGSVVSSMAGAGAGIASAADIGDGLCDCCDFDGCGDCFSC
mmetsp:Transcript_10715/g.17535  ORF Transcript_10715/g.17535 Transcript_10715/m.17535 type:complete len:792 (-) Transcript_10715:478-2853(-)